MGDRPVPLDVCTWVEKLNDRVELAREVGRQRMVEEVEERKALYDKKLAVREFSVNDLVWTRLPGLDHKLKEAWSGPWEVVERLNQVNYQVKLVNGKGKVRVVHVNTLKCYVERDEPVRRLTVVVEDGVDESVSPGNLVEVCKGFVPEDVVKLKDDFEDVLRDVPDDTTSCIMSINVGDTRPIAQTPYRVPDKLKAKVKCEIDNLLEAGIIVPSSSPWASPIVPVLKPDSSVRLCVDYRRLNDCTLQDGYYMPTLEEILEWVGPCGVLSKLDLAKGYYQVKMAESSCQYTAFISPFSKFEFTRMPFGLKNAPAVFQRLMDTVLTPG